MFDLGMQELIVIFIVALIVFGPKRLPELGRTIGKGLYELKRSMAGIKDQIDEEVHGIKEGIDENTKDMKDMKDTLIDKSQSDIVNKGEDKTAINQSDKNEEGGQR